MINHLSTRIGLLPALIFLFSLTSARSQGLEWAKRFGGTDEDHVTGAAVDPQNNLLIVGRLNGSADLDPGDDSLVLVSKGQSDIYIQKLDANGKLLWARQFGSTENDIPRSVTSDADGNIYVTGHFSFTIDFDPGVDTFNLVAGNNTEIFLLKLDLDGNLIWARKTSSPGPIGLQTGIAITVDAAGNVYTTGDFRYSCDFDPGPGELIFTAAGSVGAGDIFVQKLDANGNLVWAKQLGGTGYDSGYSIATDPDGNVVVTGYFRSQMDFDPGPGTDNRYMYGISDAYVLKLDADGNYLWAATMGGTQWDGGYSVVANPDGSILVGGDFIGTVDFDPGAGVLNMSSISDSDVFIQKLDANGKLVWVKRMGGLGGSGIAQLRTDAGGNIYGIGTFNNGAADFDPGTGIATLTTDTYKNDIFLFKLDHDGEFRWAKRLGGKDYDNGNCLAIDSEESIYAVGEFTSIADFDPESNGQNLTSVGLRDVCIAKMNQRWNFNGIVFNDLNANQLQDPGEPGLPNVIVYVPQRKLFTTTNGDGRYHFYTDIVGDTLLPVLPKPYWSVTPAFAVPDSAQSLMNFPVLIQTGIADIGIASVEILNFRPGFETDMILQIKNNGSLPVDSFKVVFDIANSPSPVHFVSAEPAPVSVNGDSLVWALDSLGLAEVVNIKIKFKTAATTNINTLISYRAEAVLDNDAYPADNYFGGRSTVVGSYDPNDKQVWPVSIEPTALDTTELRYVVRFQNTGNFPASFVVIRDTLSENLDLPSLRMLSASHDYSWRLYGERILEVRFDPIFLPDSNLNEPASHGFVAFAIRPVRTLSEGDSVSNRVGIYFDYNEPVITNTAVMKLQTIVRTTGPNAEEALEILLWPNPVAAFAPVTIDLPTDDAGAVEVSVFNLNGTLMREASAVSGARNMRLLMEGLPAGVYVVRAVVGGLQGSTMLIVE
jgi:hypothetical protein